MYLDENKMYCRTFIQRKMFCPRLQIRKIEICKDTYVKYIFSFSCFFSYKLMKEQGKTELQVRQMEKYTEIVRFTPP